jgi:hypothetical protein
MGAALPAGECKATAAGVYGLKTEVDVWYYDEVNDGLLFDPGRGKLTIYFRGELSQVCDDGTSTMTVMRPCGTSVPALYSDVAGGVIQIIFPDALWDASTIPSYMTTGHATGFNPGDTLIIDKAAGFLGVQLADVKGTWPTPDMTPTLTCPLGMGKDCFPDQDSDTNPGVTITFETDASATPKDPGYMPTAGGAWKYIPAPTALSVDTSNGAAKAYIGIRTQLGGSGVITAGCKSGVGAGDVGDFESRVFDCVLKDGTKCTSANAGFLDGNTPIYHALKKGDVPPVDKWQFKRASIPDATLNAKRDTKPSEGPLSSVVRLGDVGQTFTCADVRNAFKQ